MLLGNNNWKGIAESAFYWQFQTLSSVLRYKLNSVMPHEPLSVVELTQQRERESSKGDFSGSIDFGLITFRNID